MSLTKSLKLTRREVGASKHIPITHLNTPSIFEAHNSMIGSVLKLRGVPFSTETNDVLNEYAMIWHQTLLSLDERFCLYVTTHRLKESIALKGTFQQPFAHELDQHYHQQFADKTLYVNDIYLSVIYKGITSGKTGKTLHWFKRLSNQTLKSARAAARAQQIKALTQATQQLMISLSVFHPRLLGENDKHCGYSELMSFFSLIANAGQGLRLPGAAFAPPIGKSLPNARKVDTLYPNGNLAQYLSHHRLFFGQAVQLQNAAGTHNHFAALVTIKRYSTESASVSLDPLLHHAGEYIATHSFAIEAKDVVQERIRRHMAKLHNTNDPAVSQIDDLAIARDQIASDDVHMGYHHNSVCVLADSMTALDKAVTQIIKCYADAGMIAIREVLGQEPLYWAQIPTNFNYMARSALITSLNFVDFCPFHNYPTGFKDGNHLGSAVTILETPSKTPYFFNFHARGSRTNPSKGHTTIIGGNDSGKTVFLGFMDAQLSRYQGRSFCFDRNRGMEIYIRAMGGYYAILAPSHPNTVKMNPLQLEDTPENRQFCNDWIAQLVKKADELEVDSELLAPLEQCIAYGFNYLAPQERTLSKITALLPVGFPRRKAIEDWCGAAKGKYAYLFDNVTDELTLERSRLGFDLTHLLDNDSGRAATPVLMYLFHRITQSLDGRLVSILLDEGWQYLKHPYWQSKLEDWLPTVRKLNAHVLIATQSPATVVNSPISKVILENSATNIFFANPKADANDYQQGFNLSDAEFAQIKQNTPQSRLFLAKQEQDSTLCRLNLGHLPEMLAVLSANEKSVRLLDDIRAEVGDNPSDWLPAFHARMATC